MASAYLPRAGTVILTIPCMSEDDLLAAIEDPAMSRYRYEVALAIANRIKGGRVDPARFREVQAGAVRDAIESVSCHA